MGVQKSTIQQKQLCRCKGWLGTRYSAGFDNGHFGPFWKLWTVLDSSDWFGRLGHVLDTLITRLGIDIKRVQGSASGFRITAQIAEEVLDLPGLLT